MKKAARYVFRSLLVFLILLGLLVLFMLNPQVVYAKKHSYRQLTVYHKNEYPAGYDRVLDKALELVQQSELYKPDLKLDVFLNDGNGSSIKFILRKTFGNAFAWGYHNNVVLNGATDDSLKWVSLNGYRRLLPRLIAHEMIHCYQLKRLGLYDASPLGNVAAWKREGYAEYIAYQSGEKKDEDVLFNAFKKYEKGKNSESFEKAAIHIDGGESFAGKDYYRFWMLVKFLFDVKKFDFENLIQTKLTEKEVYNEILQWYKTQLPGDASPPSGP